MRRFIPFLLLLITAPSFCQVRVILDTDIASDYDDVGAMALLHAFADKGEARILGVVSCNSFETTVPTISVLNTYFGRPDLPVGVTHLPKPYERCQQKWAEGIISKYPHALKNNAEASEAVTLYRQLLAKQPDHSVVIITVGFFTNLAQLLDSPPDQFSTLTGKELIQKKVKKLVSMAAGLPDGKDRFREYNVHIDAAASQKVFKEWNTPIVLSGFEVGWPIVTGIPLINNTAIQNSPVKEAYQLALTADKNTKGRMSWDQTAVLVAIRGISPYFSSRKVNFDILADGTNVLVPGERFEYLTPKMPAEKVAQVIEDLMMHQPIKTRSSEVNTAKPWTYWWWMGSTVTESDITWQLENFAKAGLGGVHIIPIYGVKGLEKQAIPYLSPRWMEVLAHTVREGKRLGLGVDMTTGTGWPFGGPNVSPEFAAKKWQFVNGEIQSALTKQAVKRAAPGGEGLVLDPFSAKAMPHYVQRFDSAFVNFKDRPRAMYNDSYEVYGANWTDDFLNEFQKRRGYDLKSQWAAFTDTTTALVKIDYHQTLSELLLENYAKKWTDWSHKQGFVTRYQAHGSPGNLLDLYEASDIPETESFGTSRFPIKGLRIDDQYEVDRFGTPNALAMKFASSAAHLASKKWVSSESTTWLANHFKVSLSQIKPQLDELFVSGINHLFYHGTTYTPQHEAFPGWLFYASTNYGVHSHFWKHYPLLNKYVERSQTILQNSQADNDLLVYFPAHDLWATKASASGGIHLLEVHHVDKWLLKLPFGQLSNWLWDNGFSFDFISDDQLQRFASLATKKYKTILVPATTYIPEATLSRLAALSKAGVKVIFMEHLPSIPTGFARQAERAASFQKLLQTWAGQQTHFPSLGDLESVLATQKIRQETWAKNGLRYIRKVQNGKVVYFVANQNQLFSEGWITLATPAKKVYMYQPLTDKTMELPVRTEQGKTQLYLSLLSGESCFLMLDVASNVGKVQHLSNAQTFPLKGNWKLTFVEGKPYLPAPKALTQLGSWTSLSDSASYFSGTARYSLTFDVPSNLQKASQVVLDLGDVREVAEVTLNGQKIGTAWSLPFRLELPAGRLKANQNTLEIEVTNLSANYMRLRDTQQPDWKKFQEINMVDIQYKPFNASKWQPMPSGLLGEVKMEYWQKK